MEQAFLQEQKAALEKQVADIKAQLQRIANPDREHHTPRDFVGRFEDVGRAEDENAGEVEMYQNNLSLEADLEKTLHDMQEALQRIEKGKYGVCTNCGEAIPMERLKAYPAAATCVKCKAA